MQQCRFLDEGFAVFLFADRAEVVDTAFDEFGFACVGCLWELAVVIAVHEIRTYLRFLAESEECSLGDVRVAELLLVTLGIFLHRAFECLRDTDIIDDKTTLFLREYTIDTRDSLHEVMSDHRFIDIHRAKGRHIESGEPHIHNNRNLEFAVLCLEVLGELLAVSIVADDRSPFFRVLVVSRHHHFNLVCPIGTHSQETVVNLHRNLAVEGNNHHFAG